MKPYGHGKSDTLACPYGCCVGTYHRKRNCREVADRRRRKTARQEAKLQTKEEET